MDKNNTTYSDTDSKQSTHSYDVPNKNDKNIFKQFVMESGLSVRATNVLLNNVETLEAFELLTEESLSVLPNSGRKTVREIINFLNALRLQGEIQAPISIEELFLEPPIDSTIEMLPIFSNKPLHHITVKDLHPDFQGTVKLEDINLSHRTFYNLLNQGQKETIGDVMLMTSTDLLSLKNFGKKSLNEIKDVIRSLCRTGSYTPKHQAIESILMDYSSYENLISSYSQWCLKSKRNQLLIQSMFLFDSEKAPTLEAVGQQFGLTRERVRQIFNKAIRQFKHTANISKLDKFWVNLDKAIANGGGIIHFKDLPRALKNTFDWPSAPNAYALGQFLSIWEKGSTYKDPNDLITADCDCLSCETPTDFFKALDFSEHDSFHVAVLGSRLGAFCQRECPWNHSKETFHKAFIEQQVKDFNGLVLHEDLVLTREKWLETHCTKLEDVVCHVLESYGKPMHFTEIANYIRKKNPNFKDLSDHNLHAAVIRYDSFKIADRGTYGLASWGLNYRSVSTAIEEFLDAKGLPQRRQQIIRHLDGEFNDGNITAALMFETRFKSIGDGIYDRQGTWQKRTLEEFIRLLPETVAQFVCYFTGRNNTSYKLVMAYIFIRSMDDAGAIHLHKLKTMFYNFYLSRHKKGLVVESDSATMHRIDELDKNEIINLASRRPLESFLGSGYFTMFSQNGRKLQLTDTVLKPLDDAKRDILLITILKAVDDYFSALAPPNVIYETEPEAPSNVSESGIEAGSSFVNTPPDNPVVRVHIKKKRRGKIKL
ncbi:DNA-directed RNA polymerase subunit alpha C-terminal domain-containing protein [uncultured Desulfobacter sp.]|uniref:DNA-directed RNA polymerase subunit alpha C-terminal domain-containing protein n=1 Tax=uncultured Desulfobacter sp. TaxID=240139 RepID=UPI002AA8D346|nr:DNA-directed RNA polymerase subunit alpha C-terminal domain-containing protein [uncultured Desulfobacter sp.]